mmetsp:Transcript_49450/g.117663  ORF Transcript_49450/g.117663 Transcript_49450/m.117663 type:complete len:260 (-) Transcript_49450:609-1388(-)
MSSPARRVGITYLKVLLVAPAMPGCRATLVALVFRKCCREGSSYKASRSRCSVLRLAKSTSTWWRLFCASDRSALSCSIFVFASSSCCSLSFREADTCWTLASSSLCCDCQSRICLRKSVSSACHSASFSASASVFCASSASVSVLFARLAAATALLSWTAWARLCSWSLVVCNSIWSAATLACKLAIEEAASALAWLAAVAAVAAWAVASAWTAAAACRSGAALASPSCAAASASASSAPWPSANSASVWAATSSATS